MGAENGGSMWRKGSEAKWAGGVAFYGVLAWHIRRSRERVVCVRAAARLS